MRDLCEIILTHGFLFDGEGTVIGAHNVESVTEGHTESNVQSQLHREGRIERNKCIFDKTNFFIHTFPEGSSGNWAWLGPHEEEAR